MKLEEIARSSSTAVRTAVAPLERPPIGEAASRSALWRPVFAGAAVIIVIVGGLLVVNRGRDDVEPVTAPISLPVDVEVPKLGIESPAWIPVFATDGTQASEAEQFRFDYYGDDSDDTAFESDDLLVAWGDFGETGNGDPVDVRGVSGVIASGEDAGLDAGGTSLTWRETDGPWILLASHHADADRLLEIAEQLVVDPDAGPLPSSVALDLVASDAGAPFSTMRGMEPDSSTVVYEPADGSDRSLVLTTMRGSLAASVTAAEWWLDEPVEIELAGGTGYEFDWGPLYGGDEQQGGRLLMWAPSQGVVAQLLSAGADPSVERLDSLATTVVTVDERTWAELLRSESPPDADAASFDVLFGEGGGEIDDVTYGWAFGEIDGQLCVNVATGSGSSGSCQGMPETLPDGVAAATVDQGTSDRVANWLIMADPSVATLSVDDSSRMTIERIEASGWVWFIAVTVDVAMPTFTAMSTDGEPLGVVEPGVVAHDESAAPTPDPALADNPSATELGVDDMVVLTSGEDGGLAYWFGIDDGQLCVVTDGNAVSAGCQQPGDIVVFPTRQLADGTRTFAVLTDLPGCVAGTTVRGDISSMGSVTDGAGPMYEFIVGTGATADWEFGLMIGPDTVVLDLPPEGATSYPADLCP
ncbi:hypothetical protein BDK89_0856 [Ilumatobacter fluminis]|uniref:Uncharacterized protein n=1 Tax=Ilumatobacter fluminis TaxID=467091 RepID=A0A4R7HX33_9ACTN|nr:hypothetical protein [Ilumatobacter fluminis]TDT15290.1 hypothetical protein BDK89_0856 [Ilumatobacter fluminis]